jgi:hypothetical protein
VAPVVASSSVEPVSHAMVIPASYKVPEAPRPVVTHKKVMRPKPAVKLARQIPEGTQTVLLVVETRWAGVDAHPSITQLCIWRVTVVNSRLVNAVPAKSI